MCDGTDIRTGRAMYSNARVWSVYRQNIDTIYLNLHRLQFHRLMLPCEFVRRPATDLLRGNGRGYLREAVERGSHSIAIQRDLLLGRSRDALAIVAIGGVPEVDHAFVGFAVASIKLRQPRGSANHHRQNAGCRRIERSEVPYLAGTREPAHPVHDVVRGPTGRFVDYDDAVHSPNLAARGKGDG